MNNDVESLLRESMARVTAGMRAPEDVVRRAVRRRHRRIVMGSVTGAAVAAGACALVLALMAATVPGTPGKVTGPPMAPAADVVQRVNTALTTAPIAQMTVTISGSGAAFLSTMTTREWSYGDQWRTVTTLRGQLVADQGLSGSSVYTLVNYPARTFARQRGGPPVSGPGIVLAPGLGPAAVAKPVPSLGSCPPGGLAFPLLFWSALLGSGFAPSQPPATVVKDLHAAISCGTLTEAGRQRVGGVDAIELKTRPGAVNAVTIWVNPDTYLPVRVVVSGQSLTETADITWLTATTPNLAKLAVPIPAGFREVPLSEAGTITLRAPQKTR